eukprot:PhM_4_TR10363/c1_g1_i2/m.27455
MNLELDAGETVALLVRYHRAVGEEALVALRHVLKHRRGLEAVAALRRQLLHAGHNVRGAAVVSVLKKSTTEGREACAPDHTDVHVLRALADALLQDQRRLVHHHEDAAVDDLGLGEAHLDGRREVLLREGHVHALLLALLVVVVEALLVLLAQVTVLHHGLDGSVHGEAVRLEAVLEHGADVAGDVETHLVEQTQRTHRHTEVDNGLIHHLGVGAVTHETAGLGHVGTQNAVDEEARAVVDDDWLLADLERQLEDGGNGLLRCVLALDDLDEGHLGDGVEEVHADDALWVLGHGLELRQGQRRRVRGKETLAIKDARGLKVLQHLLLDVHHLDGGLDNNVARAELIVRGAGGDECHALVELLLVHLLALEGGLELGLDEAHALVDVLLLQVLHVHSVVLERAEVGDAAAHDTGANHADLLHLGDLVGRHARLLLELLHAVVEEVERDLVLGLGGDHQLGELLRLEVHGLALRVRSGEEHTLKGLVLALVLAFRQFVEHLEAFLRDHAAAEARLLQDAILDGLRLGLAGLKRALDVLGRKGTGTTDEAELILEAVGGGDDGVDETHLLAAVGLLGSARQDHLQRRLDAHEAGEAHRAAGTGEQTEQRLRKTHVGLLGGEHTVVARQGKLAAAAEGETVDGRDDGVLGGLDAVEELLSSLGGLAGHVHIRDGVQLLDIGADTERVLGGRDDGELGFVLGDELVDKVHRFCRAVHEGLAEGVGAAALAVHHDPRKDAAVDVDTDVVATLVDLVDGGGAQDLLEGGERGGLRGLGGGGGGSGSRGRLLGGGRIRQALGEGERTHETAHFVRFFVVVKKLKISIKYRNCN